MGTDILVQWVNDDWVRVYWNGELDYEGHEIPWFYFLNKFKDIYGGIIVCEEHVEEDIYGD